MRSLILTQNQGIIAKTSWTLRRWKELANFRSPVLVASDVVFTVVVSSVVVFSGVVVTTAVVEASVVTAVVSAVVGALVVSDVVETVVTAPVVVASEEEKVKGSKFQYQPA